MLRTLRADRFKLKLHKETRDRSMSVLTDDGSNAKLRQNTSGTEPHIGRGSNVETVFQNVPVWQLAWFIAVKMKRDVVDETGLKGNYDFQLT